MGAFEGGGVEGASNKQVPSLLATTPPFPTSTALDPPVVQQLARPFDFCVEVKGLVSMVHSVPPLVVPMIVPSLPVAQPLEVSPNAIAYNLLVVTPSAWVVQVEPPSTVFITSPSLPTAHTVLESTAWMALKSVVSPVVCGLQVAPSVVTYMRPPSLEPHPWVSDIKVASSGPNESLSDDQVAPESVLFKKLSEPEQVVEVGQSVEPVTAHAFVPSMVTSFKVHGVEVNWSHADGKPEVRATQVVPAE